MQTKNLVQSVTVRATPHDVFETLMDSRRHAKLIGASAKIGRKPGDAFNVWGGSIEGRTLELVKVKRIVQTWRSSDWPKVHYSNAVFDLAKTKDGTRLTLTQTGIPADRYTDIKQGWQDYYWDPMKELFS